MKNQSKIYSQGGTKKTKGNDRKTIKLALLLFLHLMSLSGIWNPQVLDYGGAAAEKKVAKAVFDYQHAGKNNSNEKTTTEEKISTRKEQQKTVEER